MFMLFKKKVFYKRFQLHFDVEELIARGDFNQTPQSHVQFNKMTKLLTVVVVVQNDSIFALKCNKFRPPDFTLRIQYK